MDEYISREATVQKIKQIGAENYSGMYANIGMVHAAQIVKHMPAENVAAVVRCWQCRSFNKPRLGWCSCHMIRVNSDDFCSYGKRKDSDEE